MAARMSGQGPRVSLGMPIHNAERYLEEALESLLGQSFDDFELVISDNASTDKTGDICRAYAAKDERIKYVCMRQNYGLIDNFNNVFRLSTGEYFKWAGTYLKRNCRLKSVKIKQHDVELSLLEGVLTRGDRTLSMAFDGASASP